jgi:hypothetical protein
LPGALPARRMPPVGRSIFFLRGFYVCQIKIVRPPPPRVFPDFFRKKTLLILPAALLLQALLIPACASAPKEKTDELDGTKWTMNDLEYTLEFRNGKCYWKGSTSLKNNNEGTYRIEDDRIFTRHTHIWDHAVDREYVFSEDRQKFWPSNEVNSRFYYSKNADWGDLFNSVFKKKN